MVKKLSLFILFLFCTTLLFGLTKKEPGWYTDKEKAYPSIKYICQTGGADNEEGAKSAAAAEIGRYLSVTVDSTLMTEFGEVAAGKKSSTYSAISEKITSTSSITMSGLQYSEVYYNKKDKKYYCAAYIERSKAWGQYANNADLSKSKFYSFYNQAQNKDPLTQYFWYSKAETEGSQFLESLVMLSIIDNDKTNSVYGQDKKTVAALNQKKADCLKQSKIFITVNEKGNSTYNSLAKVMIEAGLTVTKSRDDCNYIAQADVNLNIESTGSGEDKMFTSYPSLDFIITYYGEAVFNYNGTCTSKAAAYSEAKIRQKARQNLDNLINTEFKNRLVNFGN